MRVRKKLLCGIPGTENMHLTDEGLQIGNRIPARPVECIETGEIFNSTMEAARYYNVNPKSLRHTLDGIKTGHKESGYKGTRKTAGFDPKTGKSLHWRFV